MSQAEKNFQVQNETINMNTTAVTHTDTSTHIVIVDDCTACSTPTCSIHDSLSEYASVCLMSYENDFTYYDFFFFDIPIWDVPKYDSFKDRGLVFSVFLYQLLYNYCGQTILERHVAARANAIRAPTTIIYVVLFFQCSSQGV